MPNLFRRLSELSLKKYREKRKFQQTPEPEGVEQSGRGPLTFVVQLHRATRLHFDFRLELDETLKSWAVPKGPSLDPQERRLAVMVEDHPLEYQSFEGIIPKGNYGAGTVMIWDNGTYYSRQTPDRDESERVLRQGLEKGHITFILEGKKLKGEFALVRLKRGEENSWLLLKKGDEFASAQDVLEFDRSVTTNRTLDEIANEAPAAHDVWLGKPKTPLPDLGDAPVAAMLHKVKPMLTTPVARPFNREGWLFEIKWDGYRAIAEIESGRVRLYSRNLLSLEQRFTPLARSLENFGHDAVLDGEVVVVDENGRPQFQLLQDYQRNQQGQLAYYVFDILYLAGHDLRKLPLRRRKEVLKASLPSLPHVALSDHVEEHGKEFFDLISQQGLEGIIAKDGGSFYSEGKRNLSWLKIKTQQRQEAVIGGFTLPGGGRKHFGALLLGVYDKKDLIYIGHVGTGFTEKLLRDIGSRLEPLVQKRCPFQKRPPANAGVRWVKPKWVCEVGFQNWTREKVMRHPTFLGLREDRDPDSVQMENPLPEVPPAADIKQHKETPSTRVESASASVPARPKNEQQLSIDSHTLKLTNLNKVYWPGQNYTKRDLIQFYRDVSTVILPYLKDRPQSLHRHPNGIESESFYQKDVEHHPAWVKIVRLESESREKQIRFLICQDEATLVYMANLGCIEINPWSSRLGVLDRPDFFVIDLDPEDIEFDKVVDAALVVREVLELAGVEGFCKTSGKTGLHIYVPLGASCTYDQARQFAEIIARLAHQRLPKPTSLERNPKKRQQKVYLDFLQNRRGQTLAAPYSVRPFPGATVSTPLKWSEVKRGLDASAFTIRTVRKRLDKLGDLWQPVLTGSIDLAKCLDRLQQ
jgi:bifunctional non-homologous end joining protein LigD